MTDKKKTGRKKSSNLRKVVIAVIYWLFACSLLAGSIYVVIRFTSPQEEPPTPTSTPDLTATLSQALTLAVGTSTPTPSATSTTTPSLTPTASRTPLPTFTPTEITPTTTPTPTPTPTLTPPPATLVPATPMPEDEAYQFVSYSGDRADEIIGIMEAYPDLLKAQTTDLADTDYYAAFYYAKLAQSEALLRFPNDPNAARWRWGLAYNLARIGDSQAGARYATLISQGLNRGEVTFTGLGDWVYQQDPRLTLEIIRLVPREGQTSSRLLSLNTEGGRATIWLVGTTGSYQAYPLSSNFDFSGEAQSEYIWGDLTGDGIDELVIVPLEGQDPDLQLPRVFNLEQAPPRELYFKPNESFDIGLEHIDQWRVITQEDGGLALEFTALVYPPCPVSLTRIYHWNQQFIELAQGNYAVQPVPDLLGYCELVAEQAASTWSPEAAAQIMGTLLPDWPPQNPIGTQPYAIDAKDEWRYRLGIYNALAGDTESATRYFNEIIDSPIVPGSRWITPAKNFLQDYQDPQGLYQACVAAEFCDPRLALQLWMASLTPEQTPNALYYLGQGGVSVRFTSVFDFENDGIPERWFTFRHRLNDRLEFWILVETPTGAEALFVDTVEVNQPTLTRYITPQDVSIVWLGSQQSFSLRRSPIAGEPYIHRYPPSYFYADFTNNTVETALLTLLSGANPISAQQDLASLRYSDKFACLNDFDCAQYYYVLGLAHELAGSEEEAIEAYLIVWRKYSRLPFTTLARTKLGLKPGYEPPPTLTYTPTNTPTITPSPTITYTPTPTLTSSITNTPDPNASPTPSPTLTPTFTMTPTPTMTATGPTPTPTPTGSATITPTPTNTPEGYP